MKHRAKVDWWIGGAVGIGLAAPLVNAATTGNSWMYGIAAGAWALVFGLCIPQWYETAPDALVIRAGVTRRRIPYAGIIAVRPSADSRSAAALSLDRVEIEHRSGRALIAPRDQAAFFTDLAARSPQLEPRGAGLELRLSPRTTGAATRRPA